MVHTFTSEELESLKHSIRQEALLFAADIAANTVCDVHLPTGVRIYGTKAGKSIRNFAKAESEVFLTKTKV